MSKLDFINDFLKTFELPAGASQLVEQITKQLLPGKSDDDQAVVLKAAMRLFSKGVLKVPADVLAKGTVDDALLGIVKKAFSDVLGKAGQSPQVDTPEQLLAGAKWIVENRLDACGGTEQAAPVAGPAIRTNGDRHAVAIWIETDDNDMPLLPAIKTQLNPNNDSRNARAIIFNAIPAWQKPNAVQTARAIAYHNPAN